MKRLRYADSPSADLSPNSDQPALQIFRRDGEPRVRLAAVGDISLADGITHRSDRDLPAVTEEVADLLCSCDLSFGNLECALAPSGSKATGPFVAAVSAARILCNLGLSHLHVANNHILDAGVEGLATTLRQLAHRDIHALGGGHDPRQASTLVETEHSGLRFGWLAAGRTGIEQQNEGPCYCELDFVEIVERARQARGQVDLLVVSLHLGYMYVDYPDPSHRSLAHELADAGADLVLMHHPHVLQGIEVTDSGTVICYSLGNFLVDWAAGLLQHDIRIQEQTEGGIFLFDLDEHGVQRVQVVPTRITAGYTVELATGEHAAAIVSRLERISEDLSGDYVPEYLRQRAAFNTQLGLRSLLSLARGGQFRELFRMLRRARPAHLGMLLRWLRGAEPA